MNGIHDLGGMDGFGPIAPEANEPVFHKHWEARVFALDLAMGGQMPFSIEQWRHARERMDPVEYLRTSYYEHWLYVLERQLLDTGLVTPGEVESRMAEVAREAS